VRIANAAGRLVLLDGEDADHALAVDVATASASASEGRFAADPQAVYDRWFEFRAWAAVEMFDDAVALDVASLGPVVPAPRQVFAVGLNYRAHAEESGFALPDEPVVFTEKARTGDMIFSVPELVARLSAIVTLLPGDVIFTGTPAGVGVGRTPPRFLRPGDELETWGAGLGRMRHRFVRG
jgi:2-keto-4-pentenoate hydratase/2-oxohepta-3-ene-1,7-dioic acid hydratase in catechol pathway